jgi:hypothetical protein
VQSVFAQQEARCGSAPFSRLPQPITCVRTVVSNLPVLFLAFTSGGNIRVLRYSEVYRASVRQRCAGALGGAMWYGLLFCLLVLATPANAATIEIKAAGGDEPALVIVQGRLLPEDADHFRFRTGSISKAVVVFESEGGSLFAGIEIGRTIRLRNFATLVPRGVLCASACAIAWLGGAPRMMEDGALIGFHAAYRNQGGQPVETGAGNAVLGAYLSQIGLTDAAIVYVTSAAPHSMTWLSLQEASRYGIEIRGVAFSSPPGTGQSSAASTRQPSVAPERSSSDEGREEQTREFVLAPHKLVVNPKRRSGNSYEGLRRSGRLLWEK